jgi:hypothetical protein
MTREHPTEHVEALNLMRVVRLHEPRFPALKLLYAVPNGGDRNKVVAAKMKAEGVRPGVPDYALPFPAQGFHGLYIELKSRTGYASREQREWLERLRANGYRAEVCRGWEAAWWLLCDYLGIPRRGA